VPWLGLGVGDLLALGLVADGLAHHWVVHQALDQVAAVRDVRADHRGLEVAKMHAHQALGHAYGALVAFVVAHQLAQVDRRGELHPGLAPQDEDAQQPAQAPVTAQLSANSSFQGLDSLAGVWPRTR
jgi:hypothetical protein